MAAEIHILSGTRRGARLWFDSSEIVVGDDEAADVRFEAAADPGACGRKAVLLADDSGWRICNTGEGKWLVNQDAVPRHSSRRLRSGDVLRLSIEGPELQFAITSRPSLPARDGAKTSAISAAAYPESSPASSKAAGTIGEPAVSAVAGGRPVTMTGMASGHQTIEPRRPWVPLSIAGGLLFLLLGVVVFAVWHDDAPPSAAAQSAPSKDRDATSNESPRQQQVATTPPLTVEQLERKFRAAVVTLGAELYGQNFPLCSGWAVAPDRVVTTARDAAQLAKYQGQGKRVFVHQEGSNPEFVTISALRLHPRYDPNDPGGGPSMMHNIAVATLESPLEGKCPIATSGQLPKPLDGMTVHVLGYAISLDEDFRSYDKLNPFPPVRLTGRVTGTERFASTADPLPLLKIDVKAPDGADGSAVFDSEGRVVGVLLRLGERSFVVLSDHLAEVRQ